MYYFLPIVSLLICIFIWLKYGRDAKGAGTIVAEYEPPLDLSPAEVGLLQDYDVTQREITATIVDLAIKGFVAIRKIDKKKFLGTHQVYEFELKRDDVLNLRPHEKELINGLFGVVGAQFTARMQANIKNPQAKKEALSQYPAGQKSLVGRRVNIDELKPYFYTYVNQAKVDLYNNLVAAGYFKTNPLYGGSYFVVAAVICVASAIFSPSNYAIGFYSSACIFLLFSLFMRARTPKGQKAKDVIDGFCLYLKTAEIGTIKYTQTPDTTETQGSSLHVYDTFLPYAIALGLENEWSKRFDSSYADASTDGYISLDDIPQIIDSIVTILDL